MKEKTKKYRVAILVAVSVVVVACIVTAVLCITRSRITNVTNNGDVTSGESSTNTDGKEDSTTTDNGENSTIVDTGEYITNEEWIILFGEKFGLNSYVEETPYFENIKSDNHVFSYIQTMVENEILNLSGTNFETDEYISQKSAIIQLAKIYGETYIENRLEKEGLSDEDYIKFATENIGVNLKAVEDGFSYKDAVAVIDTTWKHYLSKEYENIQEIEYAKNVIDLSQVEDYTYEDDKVTISKEVEITEGAILIFATKDAEKRLFALKVTKVSKDGDKYIIDVTEPEFEEVFTKMDIEFTELVDFNEFIPAEGVKLVGISDSDTEKRAVKSGFNGDKKGTVAELEVNFTDNKLKISTEWEAAHAKFNFSEAQSYVTSTASGLVSKYDAGYEVIGKVKIKDLILNGGVEWEDGQLGFNVNCGATMVTSLSIKGNATGKSINIGSVPITANPFSPVKLLLDIYVTVGVEGEIKIEPKITTMSSIKKEKHSGVTSTGNAVTDFNCEANASITAEIGASAVILIMDKWEIADVYINAGVGIEAKTPGADKPNMLTIEVYAPTLNVGVGMNSNTVLSKMGIKAKFKIIDRSGAFFKCPFIKEYVIELYEISEDEENKEEPTIEMSTTAPVDKPTEPITEAPKPTEPPTQKPTESVTEAPKPTEPPTQKPTEPVTEATKPTEPALPQYELSSKGYDYAGMFGKCYIVKTGGKYGVVDFYGNVKIPIQYDSYNDVGNNECEFIIGNMSYVYNVDSCNLVYEFKNKEMINNYEITPNGTSKIYTVRAKEDGKYYKYRQYHNGILIEKTEHVYVDENYNDYIWTFLFVNAKTGKVLLSEQGVKSGDFRGMGETLYISDYSEDAIVLLSQNFVLNDFNLYIITRNGYEKKCVTKQFDRFRHFLHTERLELGEGFYTNGWIKFPFLCRYMFNIYTCEWIEMPYSPIENFDGRNIKYFYVGKGVWYGSNTFVSESFDLVKGNVIVSSGYEWLDFDDEYIRAKKGGEILFIDYDSGKIVKRYINASNFKDGKALVDDGVGLCYVDTSFNRVSEYIHKGQYDDFSSKSIKINGKSYLISPKNTSGRF